ncbi:MAG: helix-turn-helix transcriptional regulator [Pseudomonadota bacterium]
MEKVNRTIGARIRARRQAYGITAAQLGSALGVSGQQVLKYETGQSAIGAARLAEIAHQLQMPLGYFFAPPTHSQRPS